MRERDCSQWPGTVGPREGETIRRCTIFALALVLLIAGPLSAQHFPDKNGSILEGMTSFDARAFVAGWLSVERDRDSFQELMDRDFILSLRRDGVRVEEVAPNFLFCIISATQVPSGVVFTWDVHYFLFNPEGVHLLMWETGGIVTRPPNDFSPKDTAQQCADAFVSEWLRWNPRD